MNFAAADELDRQEFARIAAATTPRIEAFRSMTRDGLRDEIAGMMERLSYTLITLSPWLVTTKDGLKYVTDCANPCDLAPTKTPAIRRLHDAVVAAGAYKGIYVTPRSFTPDAEYYAQHAPIQLLDGRLFIQSMQLSRKGVPLPQTYKTMCRQCWQIVEHRLNKDDPLPCPNGHFVAPGQSRAKLVPYRSPTPAPAAVPNPTLAYTLHPAGPHPAGTVPPLIKPRIMTAKAQRRRAIKVHNRRLQARAIKGQEERAAGFDSPPAHWQHDQGEPMSSVIQGYKHFEGGEQYELDCPEGTWTARLDHKAWGKSQNLILYVTDPTTGAQYWLSVFSRDNYKPRDKGHDFRNDAEAGDVFEFTTNKTKGGYPNLQSARKLTSEAP
jgi:hypothetical protein